MSCLPPTKDKLNAAQADAIAGLQGCLQHALPVQVRIAALILQHIAATGEANLSMRSGNLWVVQYQIVILGSSNPERRGRHDDAVASMGAAGYLQPGRAACTPPPR